MVSWDGWIEEVANDGEDTIFVISECVLIAEWSMYPDVCPTETCSRNQYPAEHVA